VGERRGELPRLRSGQAGSRRFRQGLLLPVRRLGAAAELGQGQGHRRGVADRRLCLVYRLGQFQGACAVAERGIGAAGEEARESVGEEAALGQGPPALLQVVARRLEAAEADERLPLAEPGDVVRRGERHRAAVFGERPREVAGVAQHLGQGTVRLGVLRPGRHREGELLARRRQLAPGRQQEPEIEAGGGIPGLRPHRLAEQHQGSRPVTLAGEDARQVDPRRHALRPGGEGATELRRRLGRSAGLDGSLAARQVDPLPGPQPLDLVSQRVGRAHTRPAGARQVVGSPGAVPQPAIGLPERVVEPVRPGDLGERRLEKLDRLRVPMSGERRLTEEGPGRGEGRLGGERPLEVGLALCTPAGQESDLAAIDERRPVAGRAFERPPVGRLRLGQPAGLLLEETQEVRPAEALRVEPLGIGVAGGSRPGQAIGMEEPAQLAVRQSELVRIALRSGEGRAEPLFGRGDLLGHRRLQGREVGQGDRRLAGDPQGGEQQSGEETDHRRAPPGTDRPAPWTRSV
jgi:hypothetical protein